MTKQQAGAKGGAATLARHGRKHFQTIGKAGAAATWSKYRLSPAGPNGWAMVDKSTGKVIATIGRTNF